jgi:hypothetical protein
MFIIGGEVYDDEEIFNIDPYYNNIIDYNDMDLEYEDELDIMAVSIETKILSSRLISI